MKELTKENLINFKDHHFLTVGVLKQTLEKYNISDDALVLVERVEDKYFENENWGVYLIPGETTYFAKKHNEDVANGEFEGQPTVIFTEEQLHLSQDQFHPAWACGSYKKDTEIFLIHMHY